MKINGFHSLGWVLAPAVWLGVTFCLAGALSAGAATKRVLVVSVTEGFRHPSIPVGNRVLRQLAERSGQFTVEVVDVDPRAPELQGADGKPDKAKLHAANAKALADAMNPEALKRYDAIVFNSTTGDLPLPDVNAFLDWLKSGKGFVGVHAATDTFRGHEPLHPYVLMIGGEFKKHGPQVEVEVINQDLQHAATRHFPARFKVFDEIYEFNGFERSQVHGLLTLDRHPNDKTPGDYPIAWCKLYGKGRVLYTSLGHREDVWDPDWKEAKGERKNPPETARAFQQHLLSAIHWALGLETGSAEPQGAAR
jgi:type 1 glutamine amidotransferase